MNEINQSILNWILLVPLIGAFVVAILPDRGKLPAWLALITSLVTFGLTLHLPAHFIVGQPGFQFEVNVPWIASPRIDYHLGVDGLSVWLVVLSGSRTLFQTSADFGYGVHSFTVPALGPGQYTIHLAGTDLAGNFGRVVRTLTVS